MKRLDYGNQVASAFDLGDRQNSVATRLPRCPAFDDHQALNDDRQGELRSHDGRAPR